MRGKSTLDGDRLLPSEITRSSTEREAVAKEVTDGAVSAYVQHTIATLESAPPSLLRFWGAAVGPSPRRAQCALRWSIPIALISKRHPWLGRLVFWFTAALLLVATLSPLSLDVQNVLADKTWHFLAFGSLTLLGLVVWAPRRRPVVFICIELGAAIELLQGTTWIARDAELQDWLADIAGVAFAVLLWTWLRATKRR